MKQGVVKAYLRESSEGERDVEAANFDKIYRTAVLMSLDILADLFNLGSRSDLGSQLLETLPECRSILDGKEEEILGALRDT